MLLAYGATVNAQSGLCGTALQAAFSKGHDTVLYVNREVLQLRTLPKHFSKQVSLSKSGCAGGKK